MKTKTIFSLVVLILSVFASHAPAKGEGRWELETDPLAFVLGGYSAHLGRTFGSWKVDIGIASEKFSSDLTQSLLGNSGFESKFTSYGVKLDYIGESQTGWHLGVQWDVSRWRYTSTSSQQSGENEVHSVGPRVGYRLGSGRFYINPWIAFLGNLSGTSALNIGGQTYQPKSFQIFPTIHFGLRF